MRNLKSILCLVAIFAATEINAQQKKVATVKKSTNVQQKKADQKPVGDAPVADPKLFTAKVELKEKQSNELSKAPVKETSSKIEESASPYKTALGVKFMWGIAITGKHFFKKDQAIEAVVRYRGYSGLGNDIAITALYQYEKPIAEVAGLHWLVGAGPYYSHFSYKESVYSSLYPSSGTSSYGLAAMAGLEFKFPKAPIAISADWMPAFDFNGGGFGAESGGFGIKYTF
ncbi:hypothetical protein [Pedobacter chitinilyticus]|uniref:Outer membrane protein beta-barrel domain-containing protein n=1 Tax=Pedobacter chitinilyticus TaxID=2233776 RepID=A0A443YZY0_9SPHI|nr:hypothetical protein [Pedobacter chitinilyticus]RWU09861.1 hypothetical protein DPV69_00505 [Pedobacter chitinilyticus]